ncbi:hypothetical protein HDU84_009078 [Entophlyctis sp. JEL0112]|nr:hypothetical protein HDU84_009078 [Entophlyctis sp. JEL0112]
MPPTIAPTDGPDESEFVDDAAKLEPVALTFTFVNTDALGNEVAAAFAELVDASAVISGNSVVDEVVTKNTEGNVDSTGRAADDDTGGRLENVLVVPPMPTSEADEDPDGDPAAEVCEVATGISVDVEAISTVGAADVAGGAAVEVFGGATVDVMTGAAVLVETTATSEDVATVGTTSDDDAVTRRLVLRRACAYTHDGGTGICGKEMAAVEPSTPRLSVSFEGLIDEYFLDENTAPLFFLKEVQTAGMDDKVSASVPSVCSDPSIDTDVADHRISAPNLGAEDDDDELLWKLGRFNGQHD